MGTSEAWIQQMLDFRGNLGSLAIAQNPGGGEVPRQRVVLETSSSQRSALDQVLEGEGLSVSEWLQDELAVLVPEPLDLPEYKEIRSLEDVRDPQGVARRLRAIDWDFEGAETGYLGHDLHPYPAKFIPQIPGHLIANLSVRGDLVLDPFGGSGTTALEAVRQGRRALSIDANPVATLIGRVKTSRPDERTSSALMMLQASLRGRLRDGSLDAQRLLREHAQQAPDIPNRTKWFPDTAYGELALIRGSIQQLPNHVARNIALLAMSRIVLRVSFQDSETRYTAKRRDIPAGLTVSRFLHDLEVVFRRILRASAELQYGVVDFHTADSRQPMPPAVAPSDSVDLVVTSPPYGNANDYHLYHRFRLFWLGFDPRDLADIEIGSHLRHQRRASGFKEYIDDLRPCLENIHRLLKPGRYAAFVLGDPVYEGRTYDASRQVAREAKVIGFERVATIQRQIHRTKRSFAAAGRRAVTERILLLRKPPTSVHLTLDQPRYRMWPYERDLRVRETKSLLGQPSGRREGRLGVRCDPYRTAEARRLALTSGYSLGPGTESTWQDILENGLIASGSRKEPKYATHGLHPYKGKFYPQLAKVLMNLLALPPGARILDPFCGSGTTLLEAYLNGYEAFGCDLHPLAAKIAQAKTGILEVDPPGVREVIGALRERLRGAPSAFPRSYSQFRSNALHELERWFAPAVLRKLNWLLELIRSLSVGTIRNFLEILVSSLIREVSHQEPSDLRIRRRGVEFIDADVLGLFGERLDSQMSRLERFWMVRGYAPSAFLSPHVLSGDARQPSTYDELGLSIGCVDLIVTSPPYATALPYIDTDRLSLLVLLGISRSERKPLEESLTGSREISGAERRDLERRLVGNVELPTAVTSFLRRLHREVASNEVGFRRKNTPALLTRFFIDMRTVLLRCIDLLRPGGEGMLVVGDNTTQPGKVRRRIPTTDFVREIALDLGFELVETIPITVTKENMIHMKNAITRNEVVRIRKPKN